MDEQAAFHRVGDIHLFSGVFRVAATAVDTMIPRFFVPNFAGQPRFDLPANEAHHALNVLRLQVDDAIEVFDGLGNAQPATIRLAKRHQVAVETSGPLRNTPLPIRRLTIAVALPKGDRQRVLVEKLSELGVDRLIPLAAERAVAQPTASAIQRLVAIVIAACKQSGRNWLMTIDPPQKVQDLCTTMANNSKILGWFADPAGTPLSQEHSSLTTSEFFGLVGPEGGWTEDERNLAVQAGCAPISLSPNILRVETAAIALAAIAQQRITAVGLDELP